MKKELLRGKPGVGNWRLSVKKEAMTLLCFITCYLSPQIALCPGYTCHREEAFQVSKAVAVESSAFGVQPLKTECSLSENTRKNVSYLPGHRPSEERLNEFFSSLRWAFRS